MLSRSKILSLFFILVFISVEFIFRFQIEKITGFSIYLFEVLWVLAILLIYRSFEWFSKKKILRWLTIALLAGVLGAWVQLYAFHSGITIPFDYENKDTLLLLLLVGPLQEEFVFRLGLWKVFSDLIANKWILILITTLFFSYSHYDMIAVLPASMHDFIKFQAKYTFLLGIICGYLRWNFGMAATILAHLLFNLGFWLAR